jgi:hypothetical protein
VILGRVIIGDIAATVADLAIRQFLGVQTADSGDTEWLLTPQDASAPVHRRESLLDYERTLLQGLSSGGSAVTTAAMTPRMPQVLDDTRREIIRDAVHRGWLHHLHHDQRTSEGDELAERIRAFQRRLRQYASDQGPTAVSGPLLPYALHFGMLSGSDLPLARLAHRWVSSFSALPGWHPPAPKEPNPLDDPVPIDNDSPAYRSGYPPACP